MCSWSLPAPSSSVCTRRSPCGSASKIAFSTAPGAVPAALLVPPVCERPRRRRNSCSHKEVSMLRSGLALWAYTAPTTSAYPLLVGEYGGQIEALEFTTVAPGGFGDLACILKLPDAWLPRPELALFSRVCLRDGPFIAFGGEWSDPALMLDGEVGEYLLLSALGGGVPPRADPHDAAYNTASTAQAIIASELGKRAAFLPL